MNNKFVVAGDETGPKGIFKGPPLTLPPPLTAQFLLEATATDSPCTGGFSIEGNRKATSAYILAPYGAGAITELDLTKVINLILGTTVSDTPSATGILNRTMPLAHPVWPWLFAESITNITGTGQNSKEPTYATSYNVQPIPNFALYTEYRLTIDFTPRPYTVMTDNQITTGNFAPGGPSAYTIDGTSFTGPYAAEWLRYTDFTITPSSESVTMQTGNMIFNSSNTVVNTRVFDSLPRMFLPDSVLTFTWYQVPYRLIGSVNSFINSSLRGRVNQNAWPTTIGGTGGFPPGSLLYVSFKPTRYTPPVPGFITSTVDSTAIFDVENNKLCNIEFTFLYTNRSLPSPGGTPETPATPPTNKNFIVGGHNLQPSAADYRFHFAQTKQVDADPKNGIPFMLPGGIPSWYSFPFELLTTDVDSPGVAGSYPINQ